MRSAVTACVPLFAVALAVAPRPGGAAEPPTVAPATTTPTTSAPPTTVAPSGGAPRGGGDVEKAIRTVAQEEAQAFLRGDTAALERLWAPNLLVTASNNTIRTRAELLGLVKSGQMKLTKLDRRVERVAVHGRVAIAMGEETIVPAGGQGAGKTLRRRYTDVYAEEDGRWRLIGRQASLVAAAP
jgi:uncharacterized protein (TIGR02246 family)